MVVLWQPGYNIGISNKIVLARLMADPYCAPFGLLVICDTLLSMNGCVCP